MLIKLTTRIYFKNINLKLFQFVKKNNCLSSYIRKMSTSHATGTGGVFSLEDIVEKLNNFAPLDLAEKWDNVGLLIEPYTKRSINTILLTNDLTTNVMKEAIVRNVELIIAYHPPVFVPLKRITQSNWKEQIVSMCLENKIALYSPHTSWDCIKNGVNDWLANSLPHTNIQPIVISALDNNIGMGRVFDLLDDKLSLKDVIVMIKDYLNLPAVHVTIGSNSTLETTIRRVAVCAGSGNSILKSTSADLYITGEMSHHELLEVAHRNISVILCNHSNSERGYLKHFQKTFSEILNNFVNIIISVTDADPLKTY